MSELNIIPGECSCDVCKNACQHKPGWFTPDQIQPLADNLGLTPSQLFKEHLGVDWFADSDGRPDVFVLSPKLKGTEGGEMFPGDPRGECHWYQDGKCAIHGIGKPLECLQLGHLTDGTLVYGTKLPLVDAWNNPDAQKLVRELLGEEPQTASFDLFDAIADMLWGN